MQYNVILPRLKPWQKDVYDKVAYQGGSGRLFVLKSSRQKGKSVLANVLLLTYALAHKSTSVVVEPVIAQSRRMHKQICSWMEGTDLIVSANATLLTIEFINGSEILFKSGEMMENLRGFTVSRNGLLVIDEAAFQRREVFEILFPITEACQAPTLIISTPLFKDSTFYNLYMQGFNPEFPNVTSFDWAAYDMSEMLPPEKLEYFRKTMTPLKFRSEILGEFIEEGSYVFGQFTNCIGTATKPPKYAGLDFSTGSNEKDDYTCLVLMDEDKAVVDVKFFRVFDPMDLVDNIAQIVRATPTLQHLVVERNSIGAIYLSALKKKINRQIIKEFQTTNESKRRIVEQLIQAFSTETIKIPDVERLRNQLQHYEMEKTDTGKVTYNGADGYNDDAVIALALAYDAALKYKNSGSNNFVIL